MIEDLSRLDPIDTSRGLSSRLYNRYDANYTMETEFHSSGSLNTGPTGTGGSSGNGMSKRRHSLVSNSSRTSRQPHYSASSTVTVPPMVEKQPGITEQVKINFVNFLSGKIVLCDKCTVDTLMMLNNCVITIFLVSQFLKRCANFLYNFVCYNLSQFFYYSQHPKSKKFGFRT